MKDISTDLYLYPFLQRMLLPYHQKDIIEAGCDEAGRGCLAGPVYAAAVILPEGFEHPLLNDSKLLKEEERELLRPIIEKEAVTWAIGIATHKEIDKINILNASFLAMHRALKKLTLKPQAIIIDGNRFKKYKNIPYKCIIEGDGLYMSIAAASILAKTHRDEFMKKIHLKYPVYGWDTNKAYATPEHRSQIGIHGITPYHRKTFRMLPDAELPLDFD